ncbi:VCBS repeat-containing protein [Streptomyces sp. TRM70350]|uniref:FG-GAP repeat domain-containing protein n=1 Tax=Streptomyces sp. TRM70350 TaxID=2856165 RepID=UPI001C461B81|nr:VCBS repeat-containing protein [Streptomyces sp. TRM70350]MBV7699558.1 VCBS repeat-containing protein [Streptomyces sp. TRM70350]
MARHAFVRLVTASAALAAGLSPLLPTTAVADTPQETVVPAALRDSETVAVLHHADTQTGTDGAGTEGVYHRLEGNTGLLWTRYSDGRSFEAPAAARTVALSGTGSDILAYRHPEGRIDLWNPVDGSTRTVRLPAGQGLLGVYGTTVVTAQSVTDPDGTTRRVLHLLTVAADGTVVDREVGGLPAGMRLGHARGADASSLFFNADLDGTPRMVAVDRTTGQVQGWTRALPGTTYALVKISPEYVAMYRVQDAKVLVVPRSDLSATPVEVAVGGGNGGVDDLAVVGDWLVHQPSGSDDVKARPIAGGPEVTLLTATRLEVSAVPDGSAVTVGRTGADDWGIQRIHAGPDGKPVVTRVKPLPRPPAPIQGISLEHGRLVVTDTSAAGQRDDYARTVATHGTPTFGTRTSFTPDTGSRMTACPATDVACSRLFGTADGRIAWLEHGSAQEDTIRVDGPTGPWQRTVPAGGRITDVSGRYVLHTTADKQYVYRIDDWATSPVTRAPGAAALAGGVLWTAGTAAGAVTAYDLAAKKTTETLTTEAGCTPNELQALGRYLYWSCDGRAGVYDRTAKRSVPVPTGEAKLGDGYVVTHDKVAGKLTLTTVTDGTPASRVIGELPDTGVSQRDVRWTVDESGANAVYVDGQERVHLVPSGVAQQPLRLLGPAQNAAYVQAREIDAVPDTLTTVLLSKPSASWELTVRDRATGKVVAVHGGGAARGELSVGWAGRGTGGTLLPNGTYDWTLQATPADGVGGPLQTRGTARLHKGGPVRHDHVGPSGRPDGIGDLLTLDSSGRLTFQQGTGRGTFSGKVTGSGWSTSVRAVPVGDPSGDRCNDVLVKFSSGTVRLYKPACGAALKPSTPYTTIGTGTGWNQYDILTSPGDITKDGRPDLLARTASTGTVYVYKGTSTGKFAARVKLYDNWKTYKKVVGAGDLNGDGIGDLVAQDKANALYRYYGTGKGAFTSRVKLSSNWGGSYNVVVGVGDITGDGTADLVARDTAGVLYRVPGTGKGSFGARVRIGTGWQGYKGLS